MSVVCLFWSKVKQKYVTINASFKKCYMHENVAPGLILCKRNEYYCTSQPIKKRGLYYFAKDGSIIITFIGHGRSLVKLNHIQQSLYFVKWMLVSSHSTPL